MDQSLPEYEQTIRTKVQTVQAATLGRLKSMQGEVGKVMGQFTNERPSPPDAANGTTAWPFKPGVPVLVDIHQPPPCWSMSPCETASSA